jgi:hypothetical protein
MRKSWVHGLDLAVNPRPCKLLLANTLLYSKPPAGMGGGVGGGSGGGEISSNPGVTARERSF